MWSIDDTIKWFKFILNSKTNYKGIETKDNDYEIEDYSSSSDEEEDDDDEDDNDGTKHQKIQRQETINFKHVESCLLRMDFKAKKDLPLLLKWFQFKRLGFRNKQDCKLLCKKATLLVGKYPRRSNKIRKKSHNIGIKQHNMTDFGLEGIVQDTNYNTHGA